MCVEGRGGMVAVMSLFGFAYVLLCNTGVSEGDLVCLYEGMERCVCCDVILCLFCVTLNFLTAVALPEYFPVYESI